MKFWIIMFIFTVLIPLTMIIYGAIYSRRSPKKINMISGYRTGMSMINEDTWKFAHHHIGKMWFAMGIILLVITIPVNFLYKGCNNNTVGLGGGVIVLLQLIVMLLSNYTTSCALKKTFDEEGHYREKTTIKQK